MRIKQIVRIVRGRLLAGDAQRDVAPDRIITDSRAIKPGDFFVALSGPNFDGNDYAEEAIARGACGVIVTRYNGKPCTCGAAVIKVRDAVRALQDIAAYHRLKFRIPVVAVTGSNGKTSVKDMIAAVLSKKFCVLKSEGTKNNHIGVPQTILKLNNTHEVLVLELGTNHKGEIKTLGAIASPTIAVMTNIGPSHLEFLKDLDGVYNAKREILDTLYGKSPLVIVNGDDPYLSRIRPKHFKLITYGLNGGNNINAGNIIILKNKINFRVIIGSVKKLFGKEKKEFELNLLGVHNIYNALAAIAVGRASGVGYKPLYDALLKFTPTRLRLDLKEARGITIINDAYNSNPLSMKSAVGALANYPAVSRWVVSGDMMELGAKAASFHKMVGRQIADKRIDGLITLGRYSRYTSLEARAAGMRKDRVWHLHNHDEIVSVLRRMVKRGDAVLVKGSRGMRMETVAEKFCEKG